MPDKNNNNDSAAGRKKAAARAVFSRRRFLFLGGAAAAAQFLPVFTARAAYAPAAAAADIADFQQISAFLTGKSISPQLAGRALRALAEHNAAFAGQYQALRAFIRSSSAKTIDALKNDKGFAAPLRQTALQIISAYYLGYVGTPQPLRAHDDTIFITYSQALMYRLTSEQTPIPTYSRRQSGYWDSMANPR